MLVIGFSTSSFLGSCLAKNRYLQRIGSVLDEIGIGRSSSPLTWCTWSPSIKLLPVHSVEASDNAPRTPSRTGQIAFRGELHGRSDSNWQPFQRHVGRSNALLRFRGVRQVEAMNTTKPSQQVTDQRWRSHLSRDATFEQGREGKAYVTRGSHVYRLLCFRSSILVRPHPHLEYVAGTLLN
jgi:hypothetical protein